MSRFGPTNPAEYGDGPLNDEQLVEDGWAAGLDVWEPVSKGYGDFVDDDGVANSQLWSLREAIRQELLDELRPGGTG